MAIVTLQDVRDEGITTAMASSSKVNSYIATYEQVFNNACGQWFEPVTATVSFDGDDSSIAFFQVPIISITEVLDTETGLVVDPSTYIVYNGRTMLQDDRRNPKIALKNGRKFSLGRGRFSTTGSFGFTEADDSAPAEVKQAMLTFIIEKLLTPIVPDLVHGLPEPDLGFRPGGVVEEMTDDHRIKHAQPMNQTKMTKQKANNFLTQNLFILGVMHKYHAPMKYRTQADWRFPNSASGSYFSDIF